jgi:hypothetical protein
MSTADSTVQTPPKTKAKKKKTVEAEGQTHINT